MVQVTSGTLSYDISEIPANTIPKPYRGSVWTQLTDDVLLRLEKTEEGLALQVTLADEKQAQAAATSIKKYLKSTQPPETVTIVRSGKRVYFQRGPKWTKRVTP